MHNYIAEENVDCAAAEVEALPQMLFCSSHMPLGKFFMPGQLEATHDLSLQPSSPNPTPLVTLRSGCEYAALKQAANTAEGFDETQHSAKWEVWSTSLLAWTHAMQAIHW